MNVSCGRIGVDPLSHTYLRYTQINSKWIHLDLRAETIKLFEENKGVSFCGFGLSNAFLYMTLKSIDSNQRKNRRTALNNIKNFVSKDTIMKVKTIHRMGENICKSYIYSNVQTI